MMTHPRAARGCTIPSPATTGAGHARSRAANIFTSADPTSRLDVKPGRSRRSVRSEGRVGPQLNSARQSPKYQPRHGGPLPSHGLTLCIRWRAPTCDRRSPTQLAFQTGLRGESGAVNVGIITAPGMSDLYEAVQSWRQIFYRWPQAAGRSATTWMGYSGRALGRRRVRCRHGPEFNDKGWLGTMRPSRTELSTSRAFSGRKDFGHMDIQITIDDPKAYTKPWTMTLPLRAASRHELLE